MTSHILRPLTVLSDYSPASYSPSTPYSHIYTAPYTAPSISPIGWLATSSGPESQPYNSPMMDASPSFTPTSLSSTFLSSSSSNPYFNSLARRRQQKKMSITQTYYLAHSAHQKLTREASRADHDLRVLVGHANLLDCLMLELADAEQEQERWFNQTVSGATKSAYQQSRHVQWAETVVEDPEDDWDIDDASDLDSEDSDDLDEDAEEEEFVVNTPVRRRAPSPMLRITEEEVEENDDDKNENDSDDSDFEYDDAEDLEELALTRSASRRSPPELLSDSDGESEEDTMPPSPPQQTLDPFVEDGPQSKELPLSDAEKPGLLDQGYCIGHRQQGTLIESY